MTEQQAPVVAANTNTTQPASEADEPAAPAEGPSDSARQAQSNRRQSRATDESEERDVQSDIAVSESAPAKTASASAEGERKTSRSASSTSSRNRTASRSSQRRQELEVRQALPVTPEDEASLPPVPRGSKRARYLGTTPDGALVFGMPSNEQVYVAPPENSSRRRVRRLPADAAPPRAEPVDPAELAELEAIEDEE